MFLWSPCDVVTVIASLSAFVVSIINAFKGNQTQTQANNNLERIESIDSRLQSHDQQLTTLAMTDIANLPPSEVSSVAHDTMVTPQATSAETNQDAP